MIIESRRQRVRAETTAEILERAEGQIAEGGPTALSLNAIARDMGLSGPAIYRYFRSRDDLVVEVAASGWSDLADSLSIAAARRGAPATRFRAVTTSYRQWVLGHPERYRLMSSGPYGTGAVGRERTVPASHRSMLVLLDVLPPAAPTPARGQLHRQLKRWAAERGDQATPPALLHAALSAWTRLHGVLSLEIEGAFAVMGLDPELVYDAEVAALLDTGGARLTPG